MFGSGGVQPVDGLGANARAWFMYLKICATLDDDGARAHASRFYINVNVITAGAVWLPYAYCV